MRTPRSLAIHPGFPQHVVLRGNNKRRLFSRAVDYLEFCKLIREANRKHRVALHGVVLMANHVHMIATPETTTALSKWVGSIAQRYAWRRNRRRQASGRLFEERFFARSITTEQQLAATLAYNDLNPVRAGMVATAGEYPWSSHALLGSGRSRIPANIIAPVGWYEGLGPNDAKRRAAYTEWVNRRALERERDAELLREYERLESSNDVDLNVPRRPNRKRCA